MPNREIGELLAVRRGGLGASLPSSLSDQALAVPSGVFRGIYAAQTNLLMSCRIGTGSDATDLTRGDGDAPVELLLSALSPEVEASGGYLLSRVPLRPTLGDSGRSKKQAA